MCYLDWKKNSRAIEDLTLLIEKNPLHRKIAYIVLSIAYRRSNDYLGSLRTLSRGIMHFPKYPEAYQARADLFEYIEVFYNRKRRHSYVGHISPDDFERQSTGSF